jgi:hypothetical protein
MALFTIPVEIFNNRYDFKIPGSRKNSYKSNNLPEFREADAERPVAWPDIIL